MNPPIKINPLPTTRWHSTYERMAEIRATAPNRLWRDTGTEECDKCHELFGVWDIEYDGKQFLCVTCRRTKP